MNPIHIDGGGNAFSNSRRNGLLLGRPPHQSKVLGKVGGGRGEGQPFFRKVSLPPARRAFPKLLVRRYRLEQTVVGQERFLFNDGGLIKLGMEALHIKRTFPLGDNDGRHGVADEVGQPRGLRT